MSGAEDVANGWTGRSLDRVEHIGVLLGQWQDRGNTKRPMSALGAANEAIGRIDSLIADARQLRAELVNQIEEYGEQ